MIDGVEAYGRILDGSLANTTIALGALSSRKNEPLAAPRMNERYLKFQSQPAQ
jgi:hypothetical protein